MTRYRALFDRNGKFAEYEDDELVWLRPDANLDASEDGPQVVRDLEPYRSMIDGSVIDGRKRHRDHLRAHNCIEVGNDTSHMNKKYEVPRSSVKKTLHTLLADCGDRDVQRMIQRELKERR